MLTELVRKIHDSAPMGVLAITGGGTEAIGELLRHGNGSKTLLEAFVPYANASFAGFLGGKPDQYCSEAAARQLAMAAFQRAKALTESNVALFGVSATCSLMKENERRGREHRVFVGLQTVVKTVSISVRLTARRERENEEQVACHLILNAVAEACGIPDRLPATDDPLMRREAECTPEQYKLLTGEVKQFFLPFHSPLPTTPVIFPGSFHPVHDGHRAIVSHACQLTGKPVVAEISVNTVDKPALDFFEMNSRREALERESCFHGVYFTNAATFINKCALFPGHTFLVGFDTLLRMADPKFASVQGTINALASNDIRILAYPRPNPDGSLPPQGEFDALPDGLKARTTLVANFTPVAVASRDIRKAAP